MEGLEKRCSVPVSKSYCSSLETYDDFCGRNIIWRRSGEREAIMPWQADPAYCKRYRKHAEPGP